MKKELPEWMWGVIAVVSIAVLGFLDWLAGGYDLHFFVFYFLPVSLGAWFLGLPAALSLSFLSAIVWFGAGFLCGQEYPSHLYAVWNTMARLVAVVTIGWSVSKMRELYRVERATARTLRHYVSEIKVLEALLPICADCKKIRDEQGHWQQLESYISEHSNTQFSHGLCPDCYKKALKEAGLTGEKTQRSGGNRR